MHLRMLELALALLTLASLCKSQGDFTLISHESERDDVEFVITFVRVRVGKRKPNVPLQLALAGVDAGWLGLD